MSVLDPGVSSTVWHQDRASDQERHQETDRLSDAILVEVTRRYRHQRAHISWETGEPPGEHQGG